ncbi:hypothetical protein M406DRAFT_66304 [Cryphonectria parasitica EP155]|uniref:Uncharacterized protein n=1 Tax=Cryphonectria parasitica (strain ATCC 38755 / EP155) TaxID=660469 RepID=A0A9P4YB74_CRYP1|nr:uncharacterized protein M406DRAFT_66304 [Cryphonectria parasitica EP155]KAF3769841.1 hypothetical protein M406DRAFT_66304 [Cryphonectria parasitica EP155]
MRTTFCPQPRGFRFSNKAISHHLKLELFKPRAFSLSDTVRKNTIAVLRTFWALRQFRDIPGLADDIATLLGWRCHPKHVVELLRRLLAGREAFLANHQGAGRYRGTFAFLVDQWRGLKQRSLLLTKMRIAYYHQCLAALKHHLEIDAANALRLGPLPPTTIDILPSPPSESDWKKKRPSVSYSADSVARLQIESELGLGAAAQTAAVAQYQ